MNGKFCVECGARISIDARFCRACGRPQPQVKMPTDFAGAPAVPTASQTAPAEPVQKAEEAAEAVEAKVEAAEEKVEAAEEKAAEVIAEQTEEAAKAAEQTVQPAPVPEAPKPEPRAVPDIQSYLNNGEPQEPQVEDIPEPKPQGGLHPGYILLIGCVLFAAALLVWAIFATNKLSMTHRNKERSSSSISIVKPTEPPATSKSKDKSSSSGSSGRNEYSGVNGKAAEYIESGNYTVGSSIDAGEYIFIAEEKSYLGDDDYDPSYESFYAGVSSSEDENDDIRFGWFQGSTYLKLEKGQHLHFSWAKAYPADSYTGENDPFEHPGMFLVGKDVKAGTYSFDVLTDQGYESYAVYDSIDDVMADRGFDSHNYGIEKDEKVTLSDGQYIQLEWCRLKK